METKIHIGKMITRRIEEMNMKRTTLALKLGIPNTAIYAHEKRSSMNTDSVLRMCHALHYNFFKDIALQLPADYASGSNTPQDELIAEQAEKIKKLQWENDLLKELIKGNGK